MLFLVLIVGLVGCGDGDSSPDGGAAPANSQPKSGAQANSQPQFDNQPNFETDAKHDTEVDHKHADTGNDPTNSFAAGTEILIGSWTKVTIVSSKLALTYTFEADGEGRMTGVGCPA